MLRDNLRKFREARGLSQQQLVVVCVLALAGGLAYLLGTQANRFVEGLEQGFQLQGTWKVPSEEGPFTTVSFGFTSADGCVWQIADFSRTAPLNGYFKGPRILIYICCTTNSTRKLAGRMWPSPALSAGRSTVWLMCSMVRRAIK